MGQRGLRVINSRKLNRALGALIGSSRRNGSNPWPKLRTAIRERLRRTFLAADSVATISAPSRGPWPTEALAEGDVELRVLRLDGSFERIKHLVRLLSDDERRRAAHFRFERDAMRFLAGRAALRTILGGHLATDPEAICLTYGPRGRPELAPPFDASGLRFNLSHSGSLGLCAVTWGRRIGVDIERIRQMPDMDAIAGRMFPRHWPVLRSMPEPRRSEAFFKRWTRMEAYVKALGEGIAGARDVEADAGGPEPGQWSLESFVPEAGYIAAVAVERRICRLIYRNWPEAVDASLM